MKANEAPKEIYLATTKEVQNLDTSFVGVAHSNPEDIVEPVEYIRKDVFIEKAVSFIRNCTSYDGLGYKAKCVNIEDFKKYMEQ